MPSYVFVWENNTFGHSKVSGRTWPGHSSINITKEFWGEDDGANNKNYVSYWPSEGANFGVLGALFGKKQAGSTQWSFLSDVEAEGYLPDHVIRMDTTTAQERDMLGAWMAILNKAGGPSYRTLRKNCSTICSRVLHAGGFYAKKWAVDTNFAWSPADIKNLALKAGGTAMTWTDFLVVFRGSFFKPEDLKGSNGTIIDKARSGKFCTTGAPCQFQSGG